MNLLLNIPERGQHNGKRPYESPEIKMISIELEHSIAAGSAMVKPENMNNQVMEEWEEDPDDYRTIEW